MTLADAAGLAARRAGLAAPHMRPLAAFAAMLRASTGRPVPDADPADGGVAAEVLLLLETPGPTVGRTGLISRDNPAPTARNLGRFLAAASLPRPAVLIWNAVPFVIHAPGAANRAPRAREIQEGLPLLPPLLDLLPRLRVAVLAGRVARRAGPVLQRHRPGLTVLEMPHPSPTFVCTSPAVPARIHAVLGQAAARLALPDAA